MKRFQFTIKIGRKILYQSVFTFTKEQFESYLHDAALDLDHPVAGTTMKGMLYCVIISVVGIKKFEKDSSKWENMSTEDYVKDYPDMLVMAHIHADIRYKNPLSSAFGFSPKVGQSKNEVKINVLEDSILECKVLE
jgi:hypothetical protein